MNFPILAFRKVWNDLLGKFIFIYHLRHITFIIKIYFVLFVSLYSFVVAVVLAKYPIK